MKSIRFLFGLSVGSLLLVVATVALAQQSYPSRPVRIIVAFAPGGAVDYVARVVGQKLGEQFGQQFVVDNRGGASGAIGTDQVVKSPPDGYTLLLGEVSSLVITPQIEKVPYDPLRDLVGVSPLASGYHVLIVHPSLPAKSVKELIALAKARPGEINYASGGSGGNLFLIAEIFKTAAGISMTHIPYKGAGPAGSAVLAGETQTMFASITSMIQYLRSGRLVALAVTGPQRSPLLPKVPTLAESGLRGVEVASWWALLAPAATPREIIARLNAEVLKLAATSDYRQQLDRQGIEPFTSSPEQFSAFLKVELEKWGKVIKTSGVKSD